MFITDCLAYTDISAELTQQDDSFIVTIRANKGSDISLTLNFLQARVLAEGLLTLTGQARLDEITEATSKHVVGDIKLSFSYSTDNEDMDTDSNSQTKGEKACQLQPLSAPTEMKHLFKTA